MLSPFWLFAAPAFVGASAGAVILAAAAWADFVQPGKPGFFGDYWVVLAAAMILAARRPVLPERKILETTQDRLAEKDFIKRLGIGTADYADVTTPTGLRAAVARIGLPAVIKTRRFGYDGKGQAIIREGDDPERIWDELGTKSAILEAF